MSDIVGRLKASLKKMANAVSVDMETWNEHSNAVLEAASRIKELEGEVERLSVLCTGARLRCIEDNWDGKGALAPHPYVIQAIEQNICALARKPFPQIEVDDDGAVQFRFANDGGTKTAIVRFSPSCNIFGFCAENADQDDWAITFCDAPLMLNEKLQSLFEWLKGEPHGN